MNYSLVRLADLSADGCSVAVTHSSQTSARDEVFGLFMFQILGSPHLVLANVCNIDSFFICKVAYAVDDLAWMKLSFLTFDVAGSSLPLCCL